MLETLNSISWGELGHAYGEASEVPDLIRALASAKPEVYQGAIGRLWYTVIHQGTVYSSTAYIVPFFCELLEAPEVQNKPELLHYLAAIARGASYRDVHVREKERRETPEMQQEIAKELGWVQAASHAVSDGYATYLRLLSSPDEELRTSAAYTLCRCQSHKAEVVPVMKQRLSGERSPFVRASLLLSLGQLLEKSGETTSFFAHVLQNAEGPLVQIAAAMGWAIAMQEQTSQDALSVLLQGYELSSDVKEQFNSLPFADSDLDASISLALRCIGLSISSLVIPILLRAVRHSDGWSGLTLVPNLLYFALGEQKITRGMTISDLSDLQRDVLTAIYETEALWTFGNMGFTVGEFFEPKFLRSYSHYSIWHRDDVGAFLAGQTVFRD
jgi:hypothetical protein